MAQEENGSVGRVGRAKVGRWKEDSKSEAAGPFSHEKKVTVYLDTFEVSGWVGNREASEVGGWRRGRRAERASERSADGTWKLKKETVGTALPNNAAAQTKGKVNLDWLPQCQCQCREVGQSWPVGQCRERKREERSRTQGGTEVTTTEEWMEGVEGGVGCCTKEVPNGIRPSGGVTYSLMGRQVTLHQQKFA